MTIKIRLVPSRYLSVFWDERRLRIRLRRARGLMGREEGKQRLADFVRQRRAGPSSLPMRPRARLNLIPNLLSSQKTLEQRLGTSLHQNQENQDERLFAMRQHSYFGFTYCENSEVQTAVFSKRNVLRGWNLVQRVIFYLSSIQCK